MLLQLQDCEVKGYSLTLLMYAQIDRSFQYLF